MRKFKPGDKVIYISQEPIKSIDGTKPSVFSTDKVYTIGDIIPFLKLLTLIPENIADEIINSGRYDLSAMNTQQWVTIKEINNTSYFSVKNFVHADDVQIDSKINIIDNKIIIKENTLCPN